MSQFKVGDKIVRIGNTINSHGVIQGQTYEVEVVDEENGILLKDDLPYPTAYYMPERFVLEEVYKSPLYKALL